MSVNVDNPVYQASMVSINNENCNQANSQDSETFVCLDIFSKGFVQGKGLLENNRLTIDNFDKNPMPQNHGTPNLENNEDILAFDEKLVDSRKKVKNQGQNQETQQESKVQLPIDLKIADQKPMPENQGVNALEKTEEISVFDEKRVTLRAKRRKNQAGKNQKNGGTLVAQKEPKAELQIEKSDDIAEFDKKLDTLRKKRYAQDPKNGTLTKADLQKSVSYLELLKDDDKKEDLMNISGRKG